MFFIDFNQPIQDDPTISVGTAFDEIAAMDYCAKIFEDNTHFVQARDQILVSLMRTSLRGTAIHYENNFIRFYNTRNNTKHDAYRVMAILKDKHIPFAIHKSNGLLSIYIPRSEDQLPLAMNSVLNIDDALKTSLWTKPMKPCEMQYNGGHVITLNLRYTKPTEDGFMYVAAHPESYWKSIGFLAAIAEHLKSIIPFEFVEAGEPEVEVLGGDRYRRIPSVQIRILCEVPAENATAALDKIGFYEGLEPIL